MWREVPKRDRRAQGQLIKVVLLTTSAVMCFALLFTRRTEHSWSKADIAQATVKKYAYEAYPSWWREHPAESRCPMLEELNDYMNNKDTRDPWGGHYVITECGERGIVVHSCGEDGVHGTDDDTWSNQ